MLEKEVRRGCLRRAGPQSGDRYRDRNGCPKRIEPDRQLGRSQSKAWERLQPGRQSLEVIRKGEPCIRAVGRFFSRELFQAPDPRLKDARSQPACMQTPKGWLENAAWSRSPLTALSCIFERSPPARSRPGEARPRQLGRIKATTVHPGVRVLRRMLNVASVRSSCQPTLGSAVEFPVAVKVCSGRIT